MVSDKNQTYIMVNSYKSVRIGDFRLLINTNTFLVSGMSSLNKIDL
jgi:hypothetical protein